MSIIISAHKSDTGQRKYNEDYIWVDEEARLFILADGIGGHEAGDVASRLASTTIGSMIANHLKGQSHPTAAAIKDVITTAIETANTLVYDEAQKAQQKRKMGTTIVLALIHSNTGYISHAGDSRAYHLHGNTLTQLTKDHSWLEEFGGGQAATSNSEKSPFESALTKSIGQDSRVEPSFTQVSLAIEDWLLLCTDGLWRLLSQEQLKSELKAAIDNPQRAVSALMSKALAAGADDNLSLIALKVTG
jgi:protein phosphatase